MPFGFWVLGDYNQTKRYLSEFIRVSNAFRLLGSGERRRRYGYQFSCWQRLKCLSAFGFWGTRKDSFKASKKTLVSNAFRLLGSGELTRRANLQPLCLVSNAFRLLGSGEPWEAFANACHRRNVSNAFRLLGSGEPGQTPNGIFSNTHKSQMPFGFWVLGNA